ncbi:hypothetical protein ABZ235_32370 [Streptomyces canus]
MVVTGGATVYLVGRRQSELDAAVAARADVTVNDVPAGAACSTS